MIDPGASMTHVSETTPQPQTGLDDVLVLTFRKSFWASQEAERFPRRLYGSIVRGHSTGLVNTALLALRAIGAVVRGRPRLILFGSAHRLVPVALVLRRLGVLRAKLVVTNQVYFGPRWGRHADRVIVYSRRETEGRPTYRYLPIPADGDFASIAPARPADPYVFAGGSTLRDFDTVVAALEGTGLRLLIVTDEPQAVAQGGPLPDGLRGARPDAAAAVPHADGGGDGRRGATASERRAARAHDRRAGATPGQGGGHDAWRQRRGLRARRGRGPAGRAW